MPRSRTKLPATQVSTWRAFPSERAKQPSMVRVTNPAGELIATIDPITRQRRDPQGQLEATLSYQGFNAYLTETTERGRPRGPSLTMAPAGPRRPDYSPTLRADRDPRR